MNWDPEVSGVSMVWVFCSISMNLVIWGVSFGCFSGLGVLG